MPWFRVSIRGLLALVVLVGFGLAALRGASLGWASASLLLALVALGTATLGVASRRGPARIPWLGFVLFGGAYFLLHFGPMADWKKGYGPAHFTTWTIDAVILPRVAPELEEGVGFAGQENFLVLNTGRSGSFLCASAHALMSIVLGLVGSVIGSALSSRAGTDDADRPG